MQVDGLKNTPRFVFARNPIILSNNWRPSDDAPNGGTLSVMIDGTDIYNGRYYPPVKMDISEIVNAYVSFLYEPSDNPPASIYDIEDSGTITERNVYVYAEYDGMDEDTEFLVIPGGISKQNYRQLIKNHKDAFTARFFNPNCNFFMTTRTASWRIVMKETEVYPLYFLSDGNKQINIVAPGTDMDIAQNLNFGAYVLDIDKLRQEFVDSYDYLPNVFDVYMAGVFSCRIVIERADVSKERYRLKFRNSLGVFEIIELTGELSISPEYDDNDETTFKRYDSITADYYTERERTERRQSVTVETGVKRPDEIRFLMDMISSEEVYLLDLTDLPVKVIPSVEELTYRPRPETPQKFSVKLTIADGETNIMQDIIDGSEGRKPRVFSSQFSKQFN